MTAAAKTPSSTNNIRFTVFNSVIVLFESALSILLFWIKVFDFYRQ